MKSIQQSTVHTKPVVSHLLGSSKGTTPGLPVVGINIKFSPFPDSRIGLGRFLSRNIVVCVIVFQDFPAGLVNLQKPTNLDKRWVGCRLWLGHSNATGNTSTSNGMIVSSHRGVSGSGRYIRSGVHTVVGSHLGLFQFLYIVWICILLRYFSDQMESNSLQSNPTFLLSRETT